METLQSGADRAQNEQSKLRVIRLDAGDCSFAIEVRWIDSIQPGGAFRPSTALTGPLGYLQSSGIETPVFALPELVGQSDSSALKLTSIVVVRSKPNWGIAVEKASRGANLPLDRLFGLPRPLAGSLSGKVLGVAALDDGISYLLEPSRLAPRGAAEADAPPVRPIERAFDFPVRAPGRPQIFRFQLPGEPEGPTLLVSAGQTAAALNPVRLAGRPGGETRVLGLIAFQGIPVPVLNAGRLLGRADTRYADAVKLLVVRGRDSGQLCALPVGANLRLAQTPSASRSCAVAPGAKGLLGAFEADGETLWAFDVDAALR